MTITYAALKSWLGTQSTPAASCTLDQLEALVPLLDTAITHARGKAEARASALAKAEAAAKAAGFSSLQALLADGAPTRHVGRPAQRQARCADESVAKATFRKPYLIPDQPDTPALAVYKDRVPQAVEDFLARSPGWTLEDMHWKRIARARAARGLPAHEPWDPAVKIEELKAAAATRYG